MMPHGNGFYLVKTDNDNARAIYKPTYTSNEVCHLLGALPRPHACWLFHGHMKDNSACYGSHCDVD